MSSSGRNVANLSTQEREFPLPTSPPPPRPQPPPYRRHHHHLLHHHHHHRLSCRVLGHMTCSVPITNRKFFWGGRLWLRIPHARYLKMKCGSLSVSVRLLNMLHPFISVILNFLCNWDNFKLRQNVVIGSVISPCVFCPSPHTFHFR